jgi:His/Glu/Gln/Arg/opine family amino acid ABC transporter permease subunit
MKKAILLIFVGLMASGVLFAGGGSESDGFTIKKGTLRVGMEIGYPPMEYFDVDGKTPIGFDVEMAKAIAAKMGLKVEFVDTAWDGIFAGVNTGKYDCIMSSVTVTDERLANFNFTRPYINNTQAMVLPKGSKVSVRTPFDTKGLQVAVQGETTSDKFVSGLEAGGLNVTIRRYDKVIDCFDELKNGRVNAVVCESVVAYFYAGTPSSPYDIVWEDDVDESLGICFKKGNDALSKAVDDVLAEFFEDGTLHRLSQTIFHQDFVSSNYTLKDAISWLPALLWGAQITIGLTILSVSAGLVLSFFLALGKMSKNILINKFCSGYIFFFRGTPLLMQLYFIYYGLPDISPYLTIQSRFLAAFIAFGLNAAAYCAEIIRAAIQSIDKGQFEASRALGLSYAQTLRLVIMPQSFRRLIPPVGNEFIMVLKDASLVGMIALTDITRATRAISSSTASALVYMPAMILYLIITAVFTVVFNKLENKYSVYE